MINRRHFVGGIIGGAVATTLPSLKKQPEEIPCVRAQAIRNEVFYNKLIIDDSNIDVTYIINCKFIGPNAGIVIKKGGCATDIEKCYFKENDKSIIYERPFVVGDNIEECHFYNKPNSNKIGIKYNSIC